MRFLIDQMFPHATCELLNERGHDAVHVLDRGVDARPDAEVVAVATAEERVLVTENVKDFAGVHGVTVLCLLKSRLPPQGMHVHLAELLDKWATAHPEPYLGLHWPSSTSASRTSSETSTTSRQRSQGEVVLAERYTLPTTSARNDVPRDTTNEKVGSPLIECSQRVESSQTLEAIDTEATFPVAHRLHGPAPASRR